MFAGKTMTSRKCKDQRNVFFHSGAGDAVRVTASFESLSVAVKDGDQPSAFSRLKYLCKRDHIKHETEHFCTLYIYTEWPNASHP